MASSEDGEDGPRASARFDQRAEALRANLRRRKAQARGRAAADVPAAGAGDGTAAPGAPPQRGT